MCRKTLHRLKQIYLRTASTVTTNRQKIQTNKQTKRHKQQTFGCRSTDCICCRLYTTAFKVKTRLRHQDQSDLSTWFFRLPCQRGKKSKKQKARTKCISFSSNGAEKKIRETFFLLKCQSLWGLPLQTKHLTFLSVLLFDSGRECSRLWMRQSRQRVEKACHVRAVHPPVIFSCWQTGSVTN